MNFACDRCGKRFSTSEEAVPGRTYRIPCDCGNMIVLEVADPAAPAVRRSGAVPYTTPPGLYRPAGPGASPDPFALPQESEPSGDDPFAPAIPKAANGGAAAPAPLPDVTPTQLGPLARRDPDAASDESTEFRITGAVSFDDVLRRARRQGFLAGTAAGALAGAVVAVFLAVLTATTGVTTRESTAEAARAPAPAPGDPPQAASAAVPPASAAPRAAAAVPSPAPAPAAAPRRVREPPPRDAGAAAAEPVRRIAPSAAIPDAPPPSGPEPAIAAEPAPVGGPPAAGAAASAAEPADPVASPARAPAAAEPAAPAPARAATNIGRPVDEREVAAALRARRSALDECVAATPGDTSAARGHRFWLLVLIGPSGKVSEAKIDDPEIDATPLGVCLVKLAHGMSFAPFEGEPVHVELALQYGSSE